jgi:hypothetical protein
MLEKLGFAQKSLSICYFLCTFVRMFSVCI